MVCVDANRTRATVRIVFDGPAMAGKSTNVTQIPPLFPSHRRGELVTPHPTGGRTDYFDFLEVRGGSVLGLELYGQFLSVPGQDVLFHRRKFLLRDADCIVFVCAATDAGITEARRSWRELQRLLAPIDPADRPPLIVQVNKLDLARPGARERVLGMLGVPEDVLSFGASAATGEGVRETVVHAFRAAADRAQRLIRNAAETTTTPALTDANALLIAMQLDSERPPPTPILASIPPLPAVDTPLERVWPPQSARLILRRALSASPRPHLVDLPGRERQEWIYEAGLFRIASSSDDVFDSLEAARHALRERGRRVAALGPLAPRNQAIAIAGSHDGRFVVWTIGPWYTNLRDQLLHAARRMDAATFEEALVGYGRGVLAALRLAVGGGVMLDLSPESFAAVGASVFHVRSHPAQAGSAPAVSDALVSTLGDDVHFHAANESYIAEVETGLSSFFEAGELEALGLEADLAQCTVLTATAERARERWLSAVRGAGRSRSVEG